MNSPITGKEMKLSCEWHTIPSFKEVFEIPYQFYVCEDSGEQFTTTELDELNMKRLHILLPSKRDDAWRERVEYRKANKEWLKLSDQIALKVMAEMDKQGIKGTDLASRMGVSPQQVSKILQGRENLKLETIAKLNQALGVKIIDILD